MPRDGASNDGGSDSDATLSDASSDRSFADAIDERRRDATAGDAAEGEDAKNTRDATNEPLPTSDGSLDVARGDGARNDSTSAGIDGSRPADATIRDANAEDRAQYDSNIDAPMDEDAGGMADISIDTPATDAIDVAVDVAPDAPPDVDFVCGFAPPAPGGECPAVCNEGCAGGICKIGCREDKQCKDAALECPAGFTCQVNCVGKHACESASVTCPDLFACSLLCGDDQSCKGVTFNCGSGTCNVDCLGNNACEAIVNCGPQTCAATCQTSGPMGRPTLNCGESCDCRPCMP